MAPSTSLPNLHESLGVRFEEAQNSLVNHRKNCAGLYKTHVQAAKSIKKDFDGEQAFGDVFIDLVSRVMDVKKGPCADRTVRFVGSYVKFINDKAVEERKARESPSTRGLDDAEETPVSRFTSRLLYWLLKGFHAKNKTVRFRAVSIVAEMMAHLGEIDGDTYDALRRSLIKRIYDKESTVRSQAVIALSKLVGTEEVDELEPGEKTILELMLEIMSFDPSAEVRRAAIVSIPLTPESLDAALARTRDTDTLTRKLVYSVFKDKLHHPRQLTISQREDMIKTGLGDREAAVRVAVGKLLETWFDIALAQVKEPEEQSWTGDDSGVMRGFIQFLTFFDVVGPGEAVAADAMLSIFTTRPKLSELFVFQDAYWTNLTPESAVLARVFVEHSFSTGSQERLDTASLPVVTAFAFHIQEAYNGLLAILQEVSLLGTGDDEESEVREEEIAKKEVVLGELLRMSLKLDYMDEIGRRKVFSVTTDMLAHPQLPPGLLGPCLDLLKEIMPSERDLIRVVVETVIELREDDEQPDEPGDTSHSDISQATLKKDRLNRRSKQLQEMSEEEKRDSDLTDLRCLTLCIGMLERVNGTFEDNSTLEGILADLIIPAVKRKELAMREKGLVALGLCCLIAKNMALNSFQLFFSQVQTAPEELLLNVLQIIFDLLIVYESQFLGRSEEVAQGIITFLLGVLNAAESDCVQAILCMGLAKLLLAGLITDPRVLTSLLLTYISPSTKDNAELRQCLSYFFPAYCYSSGDNQDRMRSVFMSAYDLVISVHDELDDDQEMITPYQFGQLMIDWTNPAKAAYKAAESSQCHATLAVDLLVALHDSERSDHKTLCQLLDQLHMTDSWSMRSVVKVGILLHHHEEDTDSAADKILVRIEARMSNLFREQLKSVKVGTYTDEEFKRLYESVGLEMPDADDESPLKLRTTQKTSLVNRTRRASTETTGNIDQSGQKDDESMEVPKAPAVTPMKKASKRRGPAVKQSPPRKRRSQPKKTGRLHESDNDEDESGPSEIIPQAAPRRSARTPRKKAVIYADSESEEHGSDASIPKKSRRKRPGSSDEELDI